MIDISSSNYTITNTIYPRRQEKYTYYTKNINNIRNSKVFIHSLIIGKNNYEQQNF